jgi:hypothetical protein
MAKVVDDTQLMSNRGRAHIYPWSDWTDGQTWEVVGGEDFQCSVSSFRNGLYSIAKTMKLKVITMTLEDAESIRFRFSESTVEDTDEVEDFTEDDDE